VSDWCASVAILKLVRLLTYWSSGKRDITEL